MEPCRCEVPLPESTLGLADIYHVTFPSQARNWSIGAQNIDDVFLYASCGIPVYVPECSLID